MSVGSGTQPVPTTISGRTRVGRRGGRGTDPREAIQGGIFILPALIMLVVFLVYPMVWTIRLSFSQGLGLLYDGWIGLENYKELLTDDPDFLSWEWFPSGALINNLRWVVVYIGLSLGLGLGLAVLTTRVRYERLLKAVIFVPMAISAVAVGVIWLLIYAPDPNIGILNAIRDTFGLRPISFLGNQSYVNYAIIIGYVWASTGFVMVVLSAAIKGIPAEIMEAARVDGAGEWNIFRRIMMPMLSLPISVVTVWLFINVIKVFDIIFIMTKGGPGTSSQVIAYRMYSQTFEGGRGGYGASIAVFMLILMIPVMIYNIRRFRSEAILR